MHGDVMICPDLMDYVAKETEREASVMKQVRKAREERTLAAKEIVHSMRLSPRTYSTSRYPNSDLSLDGIWY